MGHYARSLERALRLAGYEVVFCACLPAELGSRSLRVPSQFLTRIGRLNMLLLYLVMLFDILKRGRRNFVVFNTSQEYVFPFFVRRSVNIVHDLIQLVYPRSANLVRMLRFNLGLVRKARINICDSIATQDDLREIRIAARVIYVPFDTATFERFIAEGETGRAEEKQLAALWCGTLAFHKNLDLYLSLAERFPNRQFCIVLPAREVEARIFPANIKVYSSLSDTEYMRLLLQSEMLISTSLKEGYGMPAMEALMLGIPVMLSDIAVYRELYGRFGVFFALTPDAIAESYLAMRNGAATAITPAPSPPDLMPFQGRLEQFVEAVDDMFSLLSTR